ncbi:MAG TPA: hypothetical protein PKE30_01055 [Niabella sp.]|nr:hypothetical protein [Niabella sp.]
MKVLFVSIAAPPKSGAESQQVGKYIDQLSHLTNLTLVTTPVSKKGWDKEDETIINQLRNVKSIIRLSSVASWGRLSQFLLRKLLPSLFSRPDSDFLFHKQAGRVMRKIQDKPDIIYSRSSPFSSALLALKLKQGLHKPWCMHLSDPWADSPYVSQSGDYNQQAEKKCMEAADMISFTTDQTLQFYASKYPGLSHKFFIMPNVFSRSEVYSRPCTFDNDKLTLLYSGNLYGKRTISPLLNALKLLRSSEMDVIEVLIAGNLDHVNFDLINQSGLSCIRLLGTLPAAESYQWQRRADILISIDKPFESEIDKVFLPSKIQDYVAAGGYILGFTSKQSAAWEAIQGRFGTCFEHENTEATATFLQKAIYAFGQGDTAFFKRQPAGQIYEAEHHTDRLLKIFMAMIERDK